MAPEDGVVSTPDNPSERPVVIVINSGRYTITRVEARFSNGTAFTGATNPAPSFRIHPLRQELRQPLTGHLGEAYRGVVTPGNAIRILGTSMLSRDLFSVNPVVRWTDRWGQRWEQRKGLVIKIADDEQWKP